MKSKLLHIVLLLMVVTSACREKYTTATDALDAGRQFIDACLKGDFDRASFYMVQDAENQKDLLKIKRDYLAKSEDQRLQYENASLIILEDATLNEETHIINYQNSYDKITRKVKVKKLNGVWQVDFAYTFNGNL